MRTCKDCGGPGVWHGDRSRGKLVVECAAHNYRWLRGETEAAA